MEERKRFQNKKPNNKDYKKEEDAAKGLRNTLGVGMLFTGGFALVKKYGSQIAKVASNVILKK